MFTAKQKGERQTCLQNLIQMREFVLRRSKSAEKVIPAFFGIFSTFSSTFEKKEPT